MGKGELPASARQGAVRLRTARTSGLLSGLVSTAVYETFLAFSRYRLTLEPRYF